MQPEKIATYYPAINLNKRCVVRGDYMAKEVISGIYKIELKDEFKELSSCNGVYIGQSIDIYKRWKEHKYRFSRDNNYSSILYKAMREYGVKSFNFKILEKCKHFELNKREIYWIDYYNSFENGYNMNVGGHVGCRGEQNGNAYITQQMADDIRKYYIENYVNAQDVADEFKTTVAVVSKVLRGISYLESDYAKQYTKPNGKRVTIPTEDNCRALLTQYEADKIRKEYIKNKELTINGMSKKYDIGISVIVKILHGETYLNSDYAKNINIKVRGCGKLTQKEADTIRKKYKENNVSIIGLGREYNVSEGAVRNLLKGKTYLKSSYAKNYEFELNSHTDLLDIFASVNSKNKIVKIRIYYWSNKPTYRELANLTNNKKGSMSGIINNNAWVDDDYQRFLDGDININEFANIKNVNIEDLKEWFNNGKSKYKN